ncbi:M23 family metallopeptidase [Neisseria leonii]|uniref:M23 family metallopeptidase n=1 Tax=Neisseria leonii TaxID=2995413 RepID=A0A9X4ID53_9NEIS|nr:M23 family metallopeptidase [Neisseria sp. 51.81]MDD9327356.1 M23 family metallopeptidase [Neisseria sp. 51.81]
MHYRLTLTLTAALLLPVSAHAQFGQQDTLGDFIQNNQNVQVNLRSADGNDAASQRRYDNLEQLVQSLVLNNGSSASRPAAPAAQSGFIRPVAYETNSAFGRRLHPVSKKMKAHTGIDIAAPAGTPIHAAKDGIITFSGTQRGYGRTIVIKHDDQYSTLYAHASKLIAKQGQTVKQGEVIALVGSSGTATGSNLHFEVIENGRKINPENKI